MPTLPYDVLEHIFTRDRLPRSTLYSLCLVSHEFYALAGPQLYHTVHFSSRELYNSQLFFQAITADLILARNVVSLHIDTDLASISRQPHMRILIDALPGLQMLRHLYCRSVAQCILYDARTISYIAALPRLESIHIFSLHSPAADERLMDRLPAMKIIRIDSTGHSNFYIGESRSLERLLTRSKDTLVELELAGTDLSVLDTFFGDTQYSWPKVEEITASIMGSRTPARAFPNVRRLSLLGGGYRGIPVDVLVDPTVFPHLHQLAVSAAGTVDDVSGKRDVRHLLAELAAPRFLPFLTLFNGAAFRSLHLHWTRTAPAVVLDGLHIVLEQCVNLRYLEFHISESLHPDTDVLPFLDVLRIPSGQYPASLHFIVITAGQDNRQLQGEIQPETTGVARGITRLFSGYRHLRHFQTTRGDRSEIWKRPGRDNPSNGAGSGGGGDRLEEKIFFKSVDEGDALTTSFDAVTRFLDAEDL